MTEVYVNGKFKGEVDDAKKFIGNVIEDRRKGRIHRQVPE